MSEEHKIAEGSPQNGFYKMFGAECVRQMNMVFAKNHWPLLIYFLYREKIDYEYKGLTITDLRKNLITSKIAYEYLRVLLLSPPRYAIITAEESVYAKTIYRLTPYGRKIATLMWNFIDCLLSFLVNMTNKFHISVAILRP